MADHQEKQKEVVNEIEKQIAQNNIDFSTITPVEDFANDERLCLTSVHLLKQDLISHIKNHLTSPLKQIEPDIYYFPDDSLHTTIKNVRVVNDPPTYTQEDIMKAKAIFSEVIPRHHRYSVYFYRLLLFPTNLALIGTTDPELDALYLDLSRQFEENGLVDDKKYMNTSHFFCNITLARFTHVSDKFKEKVQELSENISFPPYTVDSVSLIISNAVLKKRQILQSWNLP